MAFAEDITEFFDQDDFAVSVTLNGSPVSAIFDDTYADELGVVGTRPTILVATSDTSGVSAGDSAVIGAVTYYVEVMRPDGTGVTRILLSE